MNETSVIYRYFLTDLLSNELIAEIPFKGVSFERANRRAGSFSGNIPFIPETKGLDLYEATMPGRTGLYITRNNKVIWGGIIWSRNYNVKDRTLSVSGSEFISYFYHRNIWQTIVYGSEFIGINTYEISNSVATITTQESHGFGVGDMVRITFTNPAIDGTYKITNVPNSTTFQYVSSSGNISTTQNTSGACRSLVDTYDFARSIVKEISLDLQGLNFANEEIKPAREEQASVIQKSKIEGIARLKTFEPHGIVVGQEIEVVEVGSDFDGFHVVTDIPDEYTFTYESPGSNVSQTSLSGVRFLNIAFRELISVEQYPTPSEAIITTDVPHGATVGQTVIIDGVDGFFSGQLDTSFNGRQTISRIIDSTAFAYQSGGILNIPRGPSYGGTASLGSKVLYGEYGSFTSNSDIGIVFSDNSKSGLYQDTQIFRGYQNKTAGEILEQYSTNIDGFDYRIDCDYDFTTASFTRTFVLLSSTPASVPEDGSIYAVTELGAQNLVFEYPGNISTFEISENAEDSATRFFTQGNIPDLGQDASKPYAAASAKDMLNNNSGRDWPLLDQLEVLNDVSDEFTLYQYASDYLYESRPPIAEYKLTINGTLQPSVGSYNPGDWCSIIINDDFVKSRLASDQEPRDDIIIRKIVSYKVTVPDAPSMPEVVELTLVPDWKVDQRGN